MIKAVHFSLTRSTEEYLLAPRLFKQLLKLTHFKFSVSGMGLGWRHYGVVQCVVVESATQTEGTDIVGSPGMTRLRSRWNGQAAMLAHAGGLDFAFPFASSLNPCMFIHNREGFGIQMRGWSGLQHNLQGCRVESRGYTLCFDLEGARWGLASCMVMISEHFKIFKTGASVNSSSRAGGPSWVLHTLAILNTLLTAHRCPDHPSLPNRAHTHPRCHQHFLTCLK